jgi:hypothetical protein
MPAGYLCQSRMTLFHEKVGVKKCRDCRIASGEKKLR